MSDFNVRSDSVNVEQVMEQIRARIREKRGVDYTEQQIRELAAVKLEKFLDPRGVRSDLLAEFRKRQEVPYSAPLYEFDENTLFDSHRGVVRMLRRLFRPLFKLFFNTNALSQSLHNQAEINRDVLKSSELYYELLHNLVVELTRTTIEVKNLKMRVESFASRLEFNERRARALEGVVVYQASEAGSPSADTRAARRQPEARPAHEPPPRPFTPPQPPPTPRPPVPAGPPAPAAAAPGEGAGGEGPGQRSRRRRRRRGRRGGAPAASIMPGAAAAGAGPHEADAEAHESSQPEDARDTRPEPIEQTFGSPAHAAEPREASDRPVDGATSTAGRADAPTPDASDTDGQ